MTQELSRISGVHVLDRFRFVDVGQLDDDGDEAMLPWPTVDAIAAALAPAWDEVAAALGTSALELDAAASLVSAELLVDRGPGYYPRGQLDRPCRLLFDVALSRSAADPDVLSVEIATLGVGVGLARVPHETAVARALEVLEQALAAAGLSGLKDDEEEEDEGDDEDDEDD